MFSVLRTKGLDVFDPITLVNPGIPEMEARVADSDLLIVVLSPNSFESKYGCAEAAAAVRGRGWAGARRAGGADSLLALLERCLRADEATAPLLGAAGSLLLLDCAEALDVLALAFDQPEEPEWGVASARRSGEVTALVRVMPSREHTLHALDVAFHRPSETRGFYTAQ